MTVCTKTLRLAKPYNRAVDVAFDAPHTSSDGGLLLLRSLDERLGVSATLGALVPDARDAQGHARAHGAGAAARAANRDGLRRLQ